MSRNKVKQGWPEDACCDQCGEYLWDVLRKIGPQQFLCHNCSDTAHPRGVCVPCQGHNLPLEGHHVAMRRHDPDWVVAVCLNCHAELTQRQLAWHHQKASPAELGEKDLQIVGQQRRHWRERISSKP